MILNIKTTRQGDEHNVFLEDFDGIVDGAGKNVESLIPYTDNDAEHRHYHIGLDELIAHAPFYSFEELPPRGVIVTTDDVVFQYETKSHQLKAICWDEPVRLLRGDVVRTTAGNTQ